MHPLRQYLAEVDEPIQEFARRVGASRQTLYRIIGGAQHPKPSLARRIVEATGGAVSFEVLYSEQDAPAAGGDVIGLAMRGNGDGLDRDRLRLSLAIVLGHLAPHQSNTPCEALAALAAEAVENTYEALSKVTTRQGPDRLNQALRPVLEEILRESATPPPATMLDRGADLATQLYFHAGSFGPKR
ncbi:MAG: helix-turn-helix transcriptional regulator [Pseudomonadota bacterium]